jgi:hypothetical protein
VVLAPLHRSRAGLIALAVLLTAATGAYGQFGKQAVGSTTGAQSVTVTAQAAGKVQTVEILTAGASASTTKNALDFAAGGGANTCSNATLIPGGTCVASVTFAPTAPGVRIGAVVLVSTTGSVLGTTYLSGTGLGGLGVFSAGNVIPVAGILNEFQQANDGGLALNGELDEPSGVALDGAGNIYIADTAHNRIRMVCVTPTSPTIAGSSCAGNAFISTVAGNGSPGFSGDLGPASQATVNSPSDVAVDGAGNLYIADTANDVIRKITAATGIITTVAGTAPGGVSGCAASSVAPFDGCPATSATLSGPLGITLDSSDNLYIADTFDHRIREVSAATGIITTIAGNGFTNPANGDGGYNGDNIPAITAELNYPHKVGFDSLGNMYIPDSLNERVREVGAIGGAITAASQITTIAGTGVAGYGGDQGPATAALLAAPFSVAVDPANNVYIADAQNKVIRKVNASSGNITSSVSTVLGDLVRPVGLYLDGEANLFIADFTTEEIWEVQSNVDLIDLTVNPQRQGTMSEVQIVPVENDGNAALNLTSIAAVPDPLTPADPDVNAQVDAAAVSVPCATASPMVIDDVCNIGAVFAPIEPGNPLFGYIQIDADTQPSVVEESSPLYIELKGNATALNSVDVVLTTNPNPSGFGQPVTLTATVSTGPTTGNLTGAVTFYDTYNGVKSTLAMDVSLNPPSGTTATATFTTSLLGVGVHTITAYYDNTNDPAHGNFTSKAVTQTVLESTSTNLTSSLNPSNVGQNVTFTATVTVSDGGTLVPDGTVTFFDGANALSTVNLPANGIVTYATAALTQGAHSITAVYNGDTTKDIQTSTSQAVNQDVQSTSTVSLTAAPASPSQYGATVVFTAKVPDNGANPATGVVNFIDGGVQIGTGNLSGNPGTVTFSTALLNVGTHTITAQYQGDSNYGASTSSPLSFVVNQTMTTTTVSAAPSPGVVGTPEVITATVAATVGTPTITGTITFMNGTAVLGTGTLGANNQATLTQKLPAGMYSITAVYGGDANDEGSTSGAVALTVNTATTMTTVATSGTPALVLAPITFTATVTSNGGVPTGTVTFFSGTTSLGTGTLNAGGVATFTTSALTAGTYSITASYGGDANDGVSVSTAISQVVGLLGSATNLGSSTTGGTSPQVILVATVVGTSAGPTPTGTVTFNTPSATLGTATLDSSGVATLTPNLPAGTYTVTAVYSGDTAHSPSTSAPFTFTSTPAGFSLTATPATVSLKTTDNTILTVTLTSVNGFSDTIGLGCGSLPAGVTCQFSEVSVPLASASVATSMLTIDTNYPLTGGASAMNTHGETRGISLAGVLAPLSLFFGWILWRFRKGHMKALTVVLVLALSAAAMLATGCSGFTSSSASPGTYVIQVVGTASKSGIIQYQNVNLTITQ